MTQLTVWLSSLTWYYVVGFILFVILEELTLGLFRWLWGKIVSLLNPKPTVKITPLSASYYWKTYDTVMFEGVLSVAEYPEAGLIIPWAEFLHAKKNNEYIFIKLDIDNQTDKNIEIDDCSVEVLSPIGKRVEPYPVIETQFNDAYEKFHYLERDLRLPITKEKLFGMPMNLHPHSNYYVYLCIRIIDFPDVANDICLKIDMAEGKLASNRVYRTIVRFDKDGEKISLRPVKWFWQKARFDKDGNIRGLL